MNPGFRSSLRRFGRSWVFSTLLMLLIVTSFRSAIADWNDVPTGSMQPTILIGDRIFVNKLAYDLKIPFTDVRLRTWADPEPGHIVTCWSPTDGKRLVKRVVGIPGDTVALRGGRLVINGEPLDYQQTENSSLIFSEDLGGHRHAVAFVPGHRRGRDFGPITVPPGKLFVMGDNRDLSADSRIFGFVEREAVLGQVKGVLHSLDKANYYLPRLDRFFTRLI